MHPIVTPKKSSNIETAFAKAFLNILLSHLILRYTKLKSKVSKIEMTLNRNMLLNRIYFDAGANILKAPKYIALTEKVEERRRLSSHFFKSARFMVGLSNQMFI